MSVQKLIDLLSEIEDKSLPVFVWVEDRDRYAINEFFPIDGTMEGIIEINATNGVPVNS
jgi:hypothetical protein